MRSTCHVGAGCGRNKVTLLADLNVRFLRSSMTETGSFGDIRKAPAETLGVRKIRISRAP